MSLSWGYERRSIWGVLRLRETVSAVVLAVRDENVRRAELAWGGSIVAEWAHFVALGVFAYRAGGASAVGFAGLVRLLPAAVVAPVASSFADRFRRERFFLVVLLVEGAALAGSAAAAFAKLPGLVYAFAAVVGLSSTLVRPRGSRLRGGGSGRRAWRSRSHQGTNRRFACARSPLRNGRTSSGSRGLHSQRSRSCRGRVLCSA